MPEPNPPLSDEPHLSRETLLMAIDGELAAREAARVEAHLTACWACRVRKQELEEAIAGFVHFEQQELDLRIPPAEGPRALLRARIRELAEAPHTAAGWWHALSWRAGWAVAAAGLLLFAITAVGVREWSLRRSAAWMAVTVPNPNLTPGATVLLDQNKICMEPGANNKAVPAALRKRVFAEYGIASAEPRAYEVDYLITPALGGADDIRNLWPQSNSATAWNAEVKDMLEDHLRELVCDGQLDLATAQREIATNWIEAYKKYFHTDRPLTFN
jgi:anti-sigma factor RsiW